MFCLINLVDFCKYMIIQNLMQQPKHSKQIRTGAMKDWEGCEKLSYYTTSTQLNCIEQHTGKQSTSKVAGSCR